MEDPQLTEQSSKFFIQVAHTGVDAGVEGAMAVFGAKILVFGLQQLRFTVLKKGWEGDGSVIEGTAEQAQAQGMPSYLPAEFCCLGKVDHAHALRRALA